MSIKQDQSVPAEPKIISLPKRGGGPRTAAGKFASRRNALKHGISATTLLPEILQPGRVDALRGQLQDNARGVLTKALLDEAARHIARLEVAAQAEEAVLREGARLAASRMTVAGAPGLSEADQLFCAAVTTPALEAQMRFRRGHERGLFAALRALAFLETAVGGAATQAAKADFEAARFASEAECETFLKARVGSDSWRCPRCSAPHGDWIASRKTWECRKCKKQVGLRSGTLFERSALPLAKWFHATQLLVQYPSIGIRALADTLAIDREKTVREMSAKIRAALADETGRRKLLGLDEVFRQPKRP